MVMRARIIRCRHGPALRAGVPLIETAAGCRCRAGRGVGVKVVSGRRQRLMVGIISCTDESVEGGVARGRPDTTAPPPSLTPSYHQLTSITQ